MKIYLDDERTTPVGWVRAYWPEEVIALLERGGVEEISLDHDLGGEFNGDYRMDSGYVVLKWIEEQVFTNNFIPPKMQVHSANPAARLVMEQAIQSINRFVEQNSGR